MKYRIIEKVIQAIKDVVPLEWEERDGLFSAMDEVLDSSHYRAPEAYVVNFEQLAIMLGIWVGEPDTEWKKKIADIFADKIKIPGMTYFTYPDEEE